MHVYATSHTGRLEGACCSSVPHLHPTRHPLTSSLEKEGSLFVMDSICLFPIPTVGNMETKPPSHFPFHSSHPISSPPLSLYTSQTEHCMISYIFEWFAESETQQMQIFFLLPSDMLFFRRKSNWSVTLCTTSVIQPPIVMPGTIFLRHIFMHSCVDLDTLRKISPVSLMEGCLGNSKYACDFFLYFLFFNGH